MDQTDLVRLRHMKDAAAEAIRFTKDRARADLDTDRMLVLTIVRDLEIIGEAASRVSQVQRQSSQ